MSKAVLLSIRPNWCKKIANLRKTVEIRKTAPNLEVPFKCYIYCTKAPKKLITIFRDGEESYDGEIYHGKTKFITWDGIGVPDDIDSAMQMVIGEFVCDDIRRIGPEYCVVKEDIESAISGSCLTVPQVKDYAGWKSGMSYADLKDLYGWHISDLKIYDRPRPLSDFTRLRATKFGYEPVEIRASTAILVLCGGCRMYVMNKKWDSITNIAQCTSVYVSPEHEIKAVPTGGGNVYRLGQYETAEIARAVLNDLYMHISTGCVYQMPNDQRALVLARGMSDERPDKFAGNGKKSVRRGGS